MCNLVKTHTFTGDHFSGPFLNHGCEKSTKPNCLLNTYQENTNYMNRKMQFHVVFPTTMTAKTAYLAWTIR